MPSEPSAGEASARDSSLSAATLAGLGGDVTLACAVAANHAVAVDRDGRYPAEAMAALRQASALAGLVPIAQGGGGLSLAAVATVARRLGAVCASTAMIYVMHQIQVACLVAHGGGLPWQDAFLRRVAREQILLASATSEEGIGGNIRESLCAIQPASNDSFVVDKQAPTISYGAEAGAFLVTARRGAESAGSDQVLAVLMAEDCQLTCHAGWDALGMRGTGSGSFHLHGTGGTAQILPDPFGEVAAGTMLPVAHILWGAVWLGIAGDAVSRTRACLRSRLRSRPDKGDASLARLAEALDLVHSMDARLRQALRQRAGHAAAGEGHAIEQILLKTGMSEMALKAAEIGMRVCGFAAYRNDSPFSLGRHLRDLQSAPLMVGNEEIRARAGRLMLLQPINIGDFDDLSGDIL